MFSIVKGHTYRFKTLPVFVATCIQGLRCRKRCADCERSWNKTATEYVHMRQEGTLAKFICDECLENR